MKKLLFLFLVLFMGVTSVYSQGDFRFGVNGGIPVGDANDISDFHLGADVAYMFNVVEALDLGPMVGYSHYFINDDFDDVLFLPIAASGRFGLSSIYLGADLGYAIGLNNGNDGGFYYRPMVGYQIGILGISASFEGVTMDGGDFNSINLGIEFGF